MGKGYKRFVIGIFIAMMVLSICSCKTQEQYKADRLNQAHEQTQRAHEAAQKAQQEYEKTIHDLDKYKRDLDRLQ